MIITAKPAKTDGPSSCHKKYMDKQICNGADQIIFKYVVRSMNFCASTDMRFTISPRNGEKHLCSRRSEITCPKSCGLTNMRMSCINFNIAPKRNMGPKDFNNAGSTEASFLDAGRKSTSPEPLIADILVIRPGGTFPLYCANFGSKLCRPKKGQQEPEEKKKSGCSDPIFLVVVDEISHKNFRTVQQIPWNVSSGTIGDIENLQAGKKAEKQTWDPHENGFFKAYREVWIIGLPGQGGVLQSDCQEVDMIQVRCKGGNRAYPKFGTTELIH
ncbi:hypothetical protein HUJ04_001736 [Dendroctonus ponderosae]|nr:hypothetical protein HUJ04_001736 [Dendroctonus ponderosae]